MRKTLLALVNATVWMLLPLAMVIIVSTTSGKLPGRPEKDDMMPHGEMRKWM